MIFYYDRHLNINWIFENQYELFEIAHRRFQNQDYKSSRVKCRVTTNMFSEFDDDVFLDSFLHIYLFKEANSFEIDSRKRTITIGLCKKESYELIHLKDCDGIIDSEKGIDITFSSELNFAENREETSEVRVCLVYGNKENTAIVVDEYEINSFFNNIKMLGDNYDDN